MKKTRLSEKLNNKRGASILVALVLFLVVTMTSVLVLTATTANAGRFERQRAQEQAKAYADSMIAVLNSQIAKTDMSMKFLVDSTKIEGTEGKEKLAQDPVSCIKQGPKNKSEASSYVNLVGSTVFCADYLNDNVLAMVYNIGITKAAEYTVTLSGAEESFNGITCKIHLNKLDKDGNDKDKTNNFTITGYIVVTKGTRQMGKTSFAIPATIRGYAEQTTGWAVDTNKNKITETGVVEVKWGQILAY